MSVECFLDTNILVYAASAAPEDAGKQGVALELVRNENFGISTQVLQEFYVTVTRKMRRPIEPPEALALLDLYRSFPVALTDYPLIVSAIETSLRYRISYWDGAIIAAAQALGAQLLFTEDLAHGQQYGRVRVVNPFT